MFSKTLTKLLENALIRKDAVVELEDNNTNFDTRIFTLESQNLDPRVTVLENSPGINISTTDNLPEGITNKYFTDLRAQAAISPFKNVANGYAGLDGAGLIPSSLLPSYVDDVLEYANLGAFPVTGESSKIYVALDSGRTYRWGGSVYTEILASPGTTDAITEGSVNLFFTTARARTAAVQDAIANGVLNIAPSQNAVFDALALKANDIDASTIDRGLVNLGAQIFKGYKTFTDGVNSQAYSRGARFGSEGVVYSFTGDFSTSNSLITNVVGTLPSAANQANYFYIISASAYVPYEQAIQFTSPTTFTMSGGDPALQSGTGVTFYVMAASLYASDNQTGAPSNVTLLGSGDSATDSSGGVYIFAGAAAISRSSMTMQGITYTSNPSGTIANTYSAQIIVDGSLVSQTVGPLVTNNVYVITNYVAGDNFTNVGGTNVTGAVFRATGTTPTAWTNASTLTPMVLAGLGTRVLCRITSSVTRDQLLSGLLATQNITHDFIPSSAGGANVTQVAEIKYLFGAKHVGTISLGQEDTGFTDISSQFIEFSAAGAVTIRTSPSRQTGNSQNLFVSTGRAGGSGNTGAATFGSGSNDGQGGSGAATFTSGTVRGSVASGAVTSQSGGTNAISTANTGTYLAGSGAIAGLSGNSGASTFSSGAITSGTGSSGAWVGRSGNIQGTATAGNSGSWSGGSGNVINGGSGNTTLSSGNHSGTTGSGTAQVAVTSGNITGALIGGTTGNLAFTTGNVTNASSTSNSGDINFTTGTVAGAGVRGSVNLTGKYVQLTSQVGGNIHLFTETNGAVAFFANGVLKGAVQTGTQTVAGQTSHLTFAGSSQTATNSIAVAAGSDAGGATAGGTLILTAGNATGGNRNGGNTYIASGSKNGTGIDGDIFVLPSGSGKIRLGSSSTVGYAWIATDTTGAGSWQAVASGGAQTNLNNLSSVAINTDLIFDPNPQSSSPITRRIGTGSPSAPVDLNASHHLLFSTGTSSFGSTGTITISTPTATNQNWGPGTVRSGDINISAGLLNGNVAAGAIRIKHQSNGGGTTGTVGHVWTQTAADGAGAWMAPSGGGAALLVQDEGITLSSAVTKINFVGSGVTATQPTANEILVTIPGGSSSPIYAMAYKQSGTLTSGSYIPVDNYDSGTEVNPNGALNLTTGEFTCQAGQAGDFIFTGQFAFNSTAATIAARLEHWTGLSWNVVDVGFNSIVSGTFRTVRVAKTIRMAVGDKLRVSLFLDSSSAAYTSFLGANTISVVKVIAGSGGTGFAWTSSTKTVANNGATATSGDEIYGDTSGGAFTLLLPASPTIGMRVRFFDKKGNWTTNNLTIDRNGSRIKGALANFALNVNYSAAEFVYTDSTDGWLIFTS